MEKYCRSGQATDDNMAHADCTLDRLTHTIIICNINYFSTATNVVRAHLSVRL